MGKNNKKYQVVSIPVPHAIAQAICDLENFPDIVSVRKPEKEKNGWKVVTAFTVSLPSRAIKSGISLTGVKDTEIVLFIFPENYPRKAPRVYLRSDFPRNLPHINPGSANDMVSPCIYDGSLDDLLHQGFGLNEILYQVQDWLNKAASNSLINRNQGWEPIRYDSVENFIMYEHAKLRALVIDKSGFCFLTCEGVSGSISFYKIHDYMPFNLNGWYAGYVTQDDTQRESFTIGIRPVLFCWSDKDKEINEYFPETVTNLGELLTKSKLYGTEQLFWQQIQHLWRELRNAGKLIDVIVIHCVRRPLLLINQNTNLELLAYRVRVGFNSMGFPDMQSPVDIFCHHHAVGPELLKEMSGSLPAQMESIIQIGCGSLGSKIAMHLGRAGHGPFALIDNKYMSEHNLARHALTKSTGNKAELLKNEMRALNVSVNAFPKSLNDVISKNSNRLFERNSLIIDSTASINVRETLASLPVANNNSRIFQTGLYADGKMGFITIEGRGRNPRVDDLSASIFDMAIDNKAVSEALVGSQGAISRRSTGQGCGSYTMVIPDTKISMYSAAMAERARHAFEGNINEDGEVMLGFMSDTGMSLAWDSYALGKTKFIKLDNKDWELRVLSSAYDMIDNEVQRHPTVETGGVLIGRLCLTRKCAIVTRILEAPLDSIRSSSLFELGVEGLSDNISNIQKSSGLTYLGTWHSHLHGSAPSGIDKATLKNIKELRLGIPAFNLIWHNRELNCFADYGDY